MPKDTDEFKIDAVLERKRHAMTADGHGFGQLILSISNEGETISASEVTMTLMFPGQVDKHILSFPEGILTLKKGHSVVYDSLPTSLTRGSQAVIVLTKNTDGKEIARGNIRDIP